MFSTGPYLLSVASSATTSSGSNTESIVMVPNISPVFFIPVRRSAFASVSTALTFSNGFLSSLDYVKPSQIEGLVGIPFELSRMAVSIPTNLIQAKIDIATKNADLNKQQQALAVNQAALMNSVSNLISNQQAFQEFMRTNKVH